MAGESKFEQTKDNVKETIGNIADNRNLENEGKRDKVPGKTKEFVENAKEKVTDFVDKVKDDKGE